jgi:hypothetical protein
MADIVYLDQDDPRPEGAEDEPWLYIDERDGKYFGSGGAWRESGEWVGYGSLEENDVSLERALKAAQQWAGRFDVQTIFVFLRRIPRTQSEFRGHNTK